MASNAAFCLLRHQEKAQENYVMQVSFGHGGLKPYDVSVNRPDNIPPGGIHPPVHPYVITTETHVKRSLSSRIAFPCDVKLRRAGIALHARLACYYCYTDTQRSLRSRKYLDQHYTRDSRNCHAMTHVARNTNETGTHVSG